MRSINSAFRLAPPLLAAGCAALFGACAPGPVKTTYGVPQVNNIYAVDIDNGLPNVLMYSSVDPRVSPTPPPSYATFQIEFNQPMNGGTLAPQADRSAAALSPAIYCDPSGAGVTLTDATGVVIASSVCYDPTSDIGGNPHVSIIPGAGLAAATATAPFTCQTFSPVAAGTASGGDGSLAAATTYAFNFAPSITSASGQALTFPTAAGWTASKYTFTTAGLAIMASGFNDPFSGYYSWFKKPFPGFMKDLNEAGKRGLNKDVATCSTDVDCQLTQSAAPGSPTGQFGQVCAAGVCAFRQQVAMYGGAQTPTPFLIAFTENLNTNPAGAPADAANATAVTVARADGTAFSTTVAMFAPNVVMVTPNGSWESGTAYTVTVKGTLAAADTTTTLGTDQTLTFTAGTIDLAALKPPSPDENSTANPISSTPTVSYSVALDPSTVSGIQLLNGPTAVQLDTTVPVIDTATGQLVVLTPLAPLDAGTLYTVSIKGVVAAPATGATGVPTAPAALAGKPVKDYTYNFTTRNFNATSVKSATGASLDRAFNVTPAALQAGVTINYTEGAQAIDTTLVKVFENATTGTTSKPVAVTVTPAAGLTSATITTTQNVKFGQKYVIQSTTAMKSARGATLTAEGCQPGTGADCSDLKAFTTAPFGGKLAVTSKTAGTYTFTFNNPIDPNTMTPNLSNGSFKLFKQDAVTQARTPVTISCTQTSTTVVTCAAGAPLYVAGTTGNTVYIANVGILSPVNAAATTASGLPVDPTTPAFTGGASSTFVTPCP
jgi:hypothetical protein